MSAPATSGGPPAAVVSESAAAHGRHAAIGTLTLFGADALILPTGLLTAAFLTRHLGPDLYGLFSVTATVVTWFEVTTTLLLSRAAVQLVASTPRWHDVASTLVRIQLAVGLGAAVVLATLAPVIAAGLGSPEVTRHLRLFALDIPILALARLHRSILIARADYGRSAIATAGRWLSRMALIFLLVGLGLSVTGAILASIGASLVALALAALHVRPVLFSRAAAPVRGIWSHALPLFGTALGLHLFNRLDILMVKALGDAPEAAGFYGAAQNLTIVPGLFSASFSPLLLATLSRASRDGQEAVGRAISGQALRLVLCLLPFAGMVAGSAAGIVALTYGRAFSPAGPLVAILIVATFALLMISVNTAIMTAAGHPRVTLALTAPLAPLAFVGHLVLVPRAGPVGAAVVTTVLAWLGAGATAVAVHRLGGVSPPPRTILRVALATAGAYALSAAWPTGGGWVVLGLAATTAAIVTVLILSGEVGRQDLAFARSVLRLDRRRVRVPAE